MHINVKRLSTPPQINAQWDAPEWSHVEAQRLEHYMGDKPKHFPNTYVKIAYDDEHIYVMFRVEDNYVRAVAQQHQDSVCTDSCVEFFFAPVDDVAKGYFNLEMNCGGIMLLHFQTIPRQDQVPLAENAVNKIKVAHSMPKNVDPEITEPTTWTVEYALPISILSDYLEIIKPASGVAWKANFFKCGDDTSQPHWITWAHDDHPQPDFHRPQAFGKLAFE